MYFRLKNTMLINKQYLGIDPGLGCTGLAIVENGEVIGTEKIKTKAKGDDRYFDIATKALEFYSSYNPSVICSETQYVFRNAGGSLKLARLRGVIQGLIFGYHMELVKDRGDDPLQFIEVAPTQTKSMISKEAVKLPRKDSKKAVRAYIENLYPQLQGESEDVLDAVLIALTGDFLLSRDNTSNILKEVNL